LAVHGGRGENHCIGQFFLLWFRMQTSDLSLDTDITQNQILSCCAAQNNFILSALIKVSLEHSNQGSTCTWHNVLKEYPDIFKNTLVYTVHVWPSRRFKVCLRLLNLHVRLAQKDSEKVWVFDGEMGTHTQQIMEDKRKKRGFFFDRNWIWK
jgi:hypothetical protein